MEAMELIWQQLGGRMQILCRTPQETIGRLCLQEHQKKIYLIEEISFERTAPDAQREAAIQLFCTEAVQRGLRMIFSCRSAQNWFASHPKQTQQLAANLKTKPGF